jgi:hypothetical protein
MSGLDEDSSYFPSIGPGQNESEGKQKQNGAQQPPPV